MCRCIYNNVPCLVHLHPLLTQHDFKFLYLSTQKNYWFENWNTFERTIFKYPCKILLKSADSKKWQTKEYKRRCKIKKCRNAPFVAFKMKCTDCCFEADLKMIRYNILVLLTSRNSATGIPFKIRQPASAPVLMQQPGNCGSLTSKHTRYLKI